MSFFVSHRMGGDDRDPPLSSFEALLDEVHEDPSNIEHFAVSVTHEDDWCVSVSEGYRVIFEHLEDETIEPRHLDTEDRERALSLMRAMAAGDLETLEAQPWRPGYF
jgi:hypothetical protein